VGTIAVEARGNEAVAGSAGVASTGAGVVGLLEVVSVEWAGAPEVAVGEWAVEASSREELLSDVIRLT
jgi:hypothetical protein